MNTYIEYEWEAVSKYTYFVLFIRLFIYLFIFIITIQYFFHIQFSLGDWSCCKTSLGFDTRWLIFMQRNFKF